MCTGDTACQRGGEEDLLCARLEDVGELEGYAGEGDGWEGHERVGTGGGAGGLYGLPLRGEEEQVDFMA